MTFGNLLQDDLEDIAAALYDKGLQKRTEPEDEKSAAWLLNESERQSTTHTKYQLFLAHSLDVLRESNDNPNCDVVDTAEIRGRIAFIKELQRFGNAPETVPKDVRPDLGY